MLSGTRNTIDWAAIQREVDPALHARNEEHIGVKNHCENAMDELNTEQLDMEKKLQQHYAAYLSNPRNQAECDQQIIDYIYSEYHKAPAMHNGAKLPIEFDAQLNALPAIQQSYLTHRAHAAFRYFVLRLQNRPNQWIHPEAKFLANLTTAEGVEFKGPELGEEQINLIRAMWMAINDPKFKLAEGYTREGLQRVFLDLMAEFARVHNWDNTRPATEQVINEFGQTITITKTRIDPKQGLVVVTQAYDDLLLDKPTCLAGVTTRNSQFIMLSLKADPNETKLNTMILREKFRSNLIAPTLGKNTLGNVINRMDSKKLADLQEALDDLIVVCMGDSSDLSDKQQALLLELQCYSTQDLLEFINDCKASYGDYRFTQTLNNVNILCKNYNNYGEAAIAIAKNPWGSYYEEIKGMIDTRVKALREGKPGVVPQDLTSVSLAQFNQQLNGGAQMPGVSATSKLDTPPVAKSAAEMAQDKVLAEALRRANVSRQIKEAREVEIRLLEAQKIELVEKTRQAVINYAIEQHAMALADRMVDAGIQEIIDASEPDQAERIEGEIRELDRKINVAHDVFANQQRLSLQMDREHQRETQRSEEIRRAEEAKRAEIARLEAQRQAEMERRAKAEAARKAAEEARRKAEEEARRKAEEEARRKAEEEARRKAEEEARRKAEEEARRKAEEEARRKAEEEARRKAEEEARRKAEEEARRKAEEEARRKAEEARLAEVRRQEELRRQEAARKAAEDARLAEVRRQEELRRQEAARKAAEDARLAELQREEADAVRQVEEYERQQEQLRAQAEAARLAEIEQLRARPLLAVYNELRSQAPAHASSIKQEIASRFVTVPAKRMLNTISQNEATANILNGYDQNVVEFLLFNIVTNEGIVDKFEKFNEKQKCDFLKLLPKKLQAPAPIVTGGTARQKL